MANQYPQSFICPITTSLMKDPYIDHEGNSYEKDAILEWLKNHDTSPITRNKLTVANLAPNRALKESIDMFLTGQIMNVANFNKPNNANNIDESLLKLDINIVSDNVNTMISIAPPEHVNRTNSNICCVIDVSGSMSTEVTIQTEHGEESHGLSQLDLVKHAMKTIIKSMEKTDILSIVSYSNQAKVILDITEMDDIGQQLAQEAVDKLVADGQTNLWDGLKTGLDVMRRSSVNSNNALFLLTDGLPNMEPPRGYIPSLQKYQDEHGKIPCTINTFGFGYNLDSELLNNLAIKGNGIYAFIPDGSFVGTSFINALSNVLTTFATDVIVDIELDTNKIESYEFIKNYNHVVTSWGVSINIGSVMQGQDKNIILPITYTNGNKLNVKVKYNSPYKSDIIEINKSYDVSLDLDTNSDDINNCMARIQFINTVTDVIKVIKTSSNYLESINQINNLATGLNNKSKYIEDLLKDLTDQVTKAVSKPEWYNKWGRHYLPSLVRAHLLQQSTNFKDPGIQHYGGKLFQQIRDQIDTIFCSLPAPVPKPSYHSNQHYSAPSMSQYSNSNNPCFHGKSLVKMANGLEKRVDEIKKGDIIIGLDNVKSTVICVVRTQTNSGKTFLVEFSNGLLVTPWHPIMIGDTWTFPCKVGQPYEREADAVYSFILDSGHIMKINGVPCITLGHYFEDPIVKHEYFGTNKVLNELKEFDQIGYANGLVNLTSKNIKRDSDGKFITIAYKGN
jgi:uncharacterized protein YegL